MIFLASKSPRRRCLLQQLNIEFKTIDVEIDEQWDGRESAEDYVKRLALGKAHKGKELVGHSCRVLGADTEVIIDNVILGKPETKTAALAMLRKLSGRTHQVVSAVAITGQASSVLINTSYVSFKELSEQECEAYCNTPEPFDKAGGYAIQGKAAVFITRLEGSYSGVMGLPLKETTELLQSSS